jgi:hypothetical protein
VPQYCNSIIYLFIYVLTKQVKDPPAKKVSASKETKETHTQKLKKKQGNFYHLDNNSSAIGSQYSDGLRAGRPEFYS